MKAILFFLLQIFFVSYIYSQSGNFKSDSSFFSSSDPLPIFYSSSSLISKTTITTSKFRNGEKGIEFAFIAIVGNDKPEIRIDSIILKLSNGGILTLNKPDQDSVTFLMGGNLSLWALHRLDKQKVELLKQQKVVAIILIVAKKPLLLELTRNSQGKLQGMVKQNL